MNPVLEQPLLLGWILSLVVLSAIMTCHFFFCILSFRRVQWCSEAIPGSVFRVQLQWYFSWILYSFRNLHCFLHLIPSSLSSLSLLRIWQNILDKMYHLGSGIYVCNRVPEPWFNSWYHKQPKQMDNFKYIVL